MITPDDLSVQRATLRELFQQTQRARMELIATRARLLEDIAQSYELMARADLLLTMPYFDPAG